MCALRLGLAADSLEGVGDDLAPELLLFMGLEVPVSSNGLDGSTLNDPANTNRPGHRSHSRDLCHGDTGSLNFCRDRRPAASARSSSGGQHDRIDLRILQSLGHFAPKPSAVLQRVPVSSRGEEFIVQ